MKTLKTMAVAIAAMKNWIADQYNWNFFEGCKTPADVASLIRENLTEEEVQERFDVSRDELIRDSIDYVIDRMIEEIKTANADDNTLEEYNNPTESMQQWVADQYNWNLFEGCKTPADVAGLLREILTEEEVQEKFGVTLNELITYSIGYVRDRLK